MGKKSIYTLPLICIVTLACQTSRIDKSKSELKEIVYDENTVSKSVLYASAKNNDYIEVKTATENRSATNLPVNIKYLDMSAFDDRHEVKQIDYQKNTISKTSKKIILNSQEKQINKKDQSSTADSIYSSFLPSSENTHNSNIGSLYQYFMQERKGMRFEELELKHFKYKIEADSVSDILKVKEISKVENKERYTHIYLSDMILLGLFSLLLILIVKFLVDKIK